MIKIFTLRYYKYISGLMLIAVSISLSSFTPAASYNFDGLQPKIVKCYPNPAVSFINFDIPADYLSKNYSLQVYSFTGKKMYETVITSAKINLTFNNEYYRGIYVYQLQTNAGKVLETGKFQVNR